MLGFNLQLWCHKDISGIQKHFVDLFAKKSICIMKHKIKFQKYIRKIIFNYKNMQLYLYNIF